MRRFQGRIASWWGARSDRARDVIVGVPLVLTTGPVLAIAALLEPSPAGVGTHKQLGLGGCTVLTLTGWPCPMCGMTTTFSHMAHLSPVEALWTQPFGVVLFLITLTAFGIGGAAIAGLGWWRSVASVVLTYEVQIAVGALVGMTAGWAYKCLSMGLFMA